MVKTQLIYEVYLPSILLIYPMKIRETSQLLFLLSSRRMQNRFIFWCLLGKNTGVPGISQVHTCKISFIQQALVEKQL